MNFFGITPEMKESPFFSSGYKRVSTEGVRLLYGPLSFSLSRQVGSRCFSWWELKGLPNEENFKSAISERLCHKGK